MKTTHKIKPTYLTDGGMETSLIFHEGQDLPEFAAFHLLRNRAGRYLLRNYYRKYLEIAFEYQTRFILESPTWRANCDWGRKIGYNEDELRKMNELAIREMRDLQTEFHSFIPEILISGCVGPRGDGYQPGAQMGVKESEAYHATQIRTLADSGADLICAMTLNYTEEAVGIVNAARKAGIRPVISFTLETDGCLATGESLQQAIERTDQLTNEGAEYFMVNCAHPIHLKNTFRNCGKWSQRLGGIRANASQLSHEELDNSETLDSGNPVDLSQRVLVLKSKLPELNVFGGCCGTDSRHVRMIARAVASI